MELLARAQFLRRLTWLGAGSLLWAAAILLRLAQLQIFQHGEYRKLAEQQQQQLVEIPAPRGAIFDRTGEPLAMSVPMQSVCVNPQRVPNLAVASDLLSSILGLDPVVLYGRLRWSFNHRRGFMWVKRRIDLDQSKRLKGLGLDWIEFRTESQRHFPKGSVAAHVLGSVDHEEHGNGGIELGLDDLLAGHAGSALLLTDVKGRGFDSQTADQPVPGVNLTLTIDERIQYTAERELKAAVARTGAATGSVVVMNPQTGDLLAVASYPTFDPNQPPRRGESLACRLNTAIAAPFEPGSVFKVITLSAALETTDLRPESRINCGSGALTIAGRTVHEASNHGYGTITMAEVLAMSSNIGAIQIGSRVGQQNLYEYVRRFGFGQSAGLPLPAENPGKVRRLRHWQPTSLASVSMGHEVGVTTLQLAQASSVIANGGLLVKPRIVLLRQRPGGPVERELPEPPRRVLKPETAFAMRLMMEGVVRHPRGTGHRARLDGYSSAGKTGTGKIYDFAARRYTDTYNASFMGFAPVTNPAIVVVVTLNGTRGKSGYGGVAAAPVFKTVAEEALRVLEVPKDIPEIGPDKDEPADPDDLAIADLSIPEAPDPAPAPAAASLAQLAPVALPGPKVPDFRGLPVREVVERAQAMGLDLRLEGTGVAREQEPVPGSPLVVGETIRVRFSR